MANIVKTLRFNGVDYALKDAQVRDRLEGKPVSWIIDANITTGSHGYKYINAITNEEFIYNSSIQYGGLGDPIGNAFFKDNNNTVQIGTDEQDYILVLDYSTYQTANNNYYFIHVSDLRMGDDIFIYQTNYPDRWLEHFCGATDIYTFYAYESKTQTNNLALRSETGKIATFNTTGPSNGSTNDAGADTLTTSEGGALSKKGGSVTIKVYAPDSNTGNAAGQTITTSLSFDYQKIDNTTANDGSSTIIINDKKNVSSAKATTITMSGTISIPSVAEAHQTILTDIEDKEDGATFGGHSHNVGKVNTTSVQLSKISSVTADSYKRGTYNAGTRPSLTIKSATVVYGLDEWSCDTYNALTGVTCTKTAGFATEVNPTKTALSVSTAGTVPFTVDGTTLKINTGNFLKTASCSQAFVSNITTTNKKAAALTGVASNGAVSGIKVTGLATKEITVPITFRAGTASSHADDSFTAMATGATIFSTSSITYGTNISTDAEADVQMFGNEIYTIDTANMAYAEVVGSVASAVSVSGDNTLAVTGSVNYAAHNHSIVHSAQNITLSISKNIGQHQHSVTSTETTKTDGTTEVSLAAHTHSVTLSNHNHTLSGHTHSVTTTAVSS